MNVWDIVIIAIVAGILSIAFAISRRKGGRSCGCGSTDCHGCDRCSDQDRSPDRGPSEQ